MPWDMCGGQMAALWSSFSPSFLYMFSGEQIQVHGLASQMPLSAEPSHWSLQAHMQVLGIKLQPSCLFQVSVSSVDPSP